MKLPIPVHLAAVLPSLFEQLGLPPIFQSPSAERLLEPGIEPAGMDSQHVAHAADVELLLMPLDERVSHSSPVRRCSHRREGCILGEIRGGFF